MPTPENVASDDLRFDLSAPIDLEPNIPLALDDDPLATLPPDEINLPAPRETSGLPSLRDPAARPAGVGIPGAPAGASAVRATINMSAPAMPAVVPHPSTPVASDGLDLPTLAAAGLPVVSSALPTLSAGLPMPAAGLPMQAAGLPMQAAGLPMQAAGLPMQAAGLPMQAAELPGFAAEPPALETAKPFGGEPRELSLGDVPSEPPTATPGLKLGRIGIEKKAFTISNADDLPALAPDPAALPAPMPVKTGRAARRDAPREAPDVVVAKQESARSGTLSTFPPTPPAPTFGELDLGPPGAQGESLRGNPTGGQGDLNAPPRGDHDFSLPSATADRGPMISDLPPPPSSPLADLGFDVPASPVAGPTGLRGFNKAAFRQEPAASARLRLSRKQLALYGALGFAATLVLGGAALSLTQYGPFGRNWFDERINGPERHAAAQRVIQYVDRVLEHDTHERAIGALARLDQAVSRVPQELELKAYTAYANNLVVLRFGADPTRTARARTLLQELREAPASLAWLNVARGAEALAQGNAREALRLARLDPTAGRDLATMAAARLNNPDEWLRAAQQGRQRRPSSRSRYLLARALRATGDIAGARGTAEEVLRYEPEHSGARVLLAQLSGASTTERSRALELLTDLVRDRGARSSLGASAGERAEACVVAGQIELARDRVGVAQQRFQRALELDPRNAAALVGIGQILARQGNHADALARFRNALSADPADLDAVVGLAQAHVALRQANEARAVLEPAVRAHPNEGRLHYWLGRALAATTDQRAAAQQSFREAIRLQPDSLEAYVALSELLIQLQRNDAADQVLLEARARVADNAAIHRALAFGRLARGDLAGAEAELRTAVQREAGDLRAHFQLGDVLRRRGQLDDAQREFELVARTDPAFAGLSLARGQLAEARGQLTEALTTFREALARDPTNVELINRVASTLVALGNFGDADQMLRSVVVDHPTNGEAQYLMGRARLGVNNNDDALRYLDRAIELNPQRADYNAYAAEVHRRLGDMHRAMQLAEASIGLDPNYPRGYWVRADLKLAQGLANQALADINEAVRRDRNFWEAYATWAEIDDALGRRDAAIELYRTATARDGRHGDWFYNLGRLLADDGRGGEARGPLAQARTLGAALSPKPVWYVQATRILADLERPTNPAEARRLYTELMQLLPANSPAFNAARNALIDMAQQ